VPGQARLPGKEYKHKNPVDERRFGLFKTIARVRHAVADLQA